MEISKNLPDERRYVLLENLMKKPIQPNWNDNGLSKEKANNHLKENGNAGFLLGKGYLCIDCDSIELQLATEHLIKTLTYTQQSAKRRFKQYIFKINFHQESLSLKHKGKDVGDILADTKNNKGKQVVLAPSKYQITEEDIRKNPELNLKLGDIREYTIVEDRIIAELSKEELLKLILQFDSNLTKEVKEPAESKNEYYKKSKVDIIKITDVLSVSGMEQDSRGQYFGSNPWHGSSGGHNFYINTEKNLAYCFHNNCDCPINPIKAIALKAGILKKCTDPKPTGKAFWDTLKYAKENEIITEELYDEIEQENEEDQDDETEEDNTGKNIDETNSIQKKCEIDLWTIKDYKKLKRKNKYIIKDFLVPGELGMFYGSSGGYKSLFILYLCLCVAYGKKFLDKFSIRKQKIMILSAENPDYVNRVHLDTLMKGLKIKFRKKDNENLIFIRSSECKSLLNGDYLNEIIDIIKQKEIKVLFIDTLAIVTPGMDLSQIKDAMKVFKKVLKKLRNSSNNLSVYFLEHTDKQNRTYLGSIKQKANVDVQFRIERDMEKLEKVITLYNEKARLGEQDVMSIEVNNFGRPHPFTDKIKDTTTFKLIGTDKPQLYKKGRKQKRINIIQYILEDDFISRKELLKLLKKKGIDASPSSIDRRLSNMIDSKIIERTDNGYRKVKQK